jgi:hypothetical protein
MLMVIVDNKRLRPGHGPALALSMEPEIRPALLEALLLETTPTELHFVRNPFRVPPGGPRRGRSGSTELWRARARDAAGELQPEPPAWNAGGYANNSVHRIAISVDEAP